MLEKLTNNVRILAVVQVTLGIDPIVTMKQLGVTNDVLWVLMQMLPDQRNGFLIIVFKGSRHDGQAIGALQTSLGGVPSKVRSHFDFPLAESDSPYRRLEDSGSCSEVHQLLDL